MRHWQIWKVLYDDPTQRLNEQLDILMEIERMKILLPLSDTNQCLIYNEDDE